MNAPSLIDTLSLRAPAAVRAAPLVVRGVPISFDGGWLLGLGLAGFTLTRALVDEGPAGYGLSAYAAAGALATLTLGLGGVLRVAAAWAVARRYGLTVRRARLSFVGTHLTLDEPRPDRATSARMVAAGVLTSVVASAALALAYLLSVETGGDALLAATLAMAALGQLVLGAVSLLPLTPLDDGHVVHLAIRRLTVSDERADLVTAAVARAVTAVVLTLGVLATATGQLVAGLWLMLLALPPR